MREQGEHPEQFHLQTLARAGDRSIVHLRALRIHGFGDVELLWERWGVALPSSATIYQTYRDFAALYRQLGDDVDLARAIEDDSTHWAELICLAHGLGRALGPTSLLASWQVRGTETILGELVPALESAHLIFFAIRVPTLTDPNQPHRVTRVSFEIATGAIRKEPYIEFGADDVVELDRLA